MNEPYNELRSEVNKLLELNSAQIKKGQKTGSRVKTKAEDIKSYIEEEDRTEDYLEILSRIEKYHSKFSKDIMNSENSALESDWKEIGRQDMEKLKDEIMALQEFLVAEEDKLRKRINESNFGTDIRELAHRINDEPSIDKITRTRFLRLVENKSEEELHADMKKFEDRINRISKWLITLKEVEDVGG